MTAKTPQEATLDALRDARATGRLTTHLRKGAVPENAADRAAAYRLRDEANKEKARNFERANRTRVNAWVGQKDNPR